MYARFPKTTACFLLLAGLFLLIAGTSAAESLDEHKGADDPFVSERANLWIAQTDTPGGCVAISQQAEKAAQAAEQAAEKANKAAEEARIAGEAVDRAKEAGEATENITRAAQTALKAAEAAEKAAAEAEAAAAAARRVAEEAELLGCLEVASIAEQAAQDAESAAQKARTIAESNTERLQYFRPEFMDTQTTEDQWYQETGREKEVSPMQ